jgi:hypothetical protein
MRSCLFWGALVAAAVGCSTTSHPDGCAIRDTLIARGATNPQNPCQFCRPQIRTNDWSEAPAGTPCGDAGAICSAGSCQNGCLIAPIFYAAGAQNPSAPCQSCQPESDNFGWSPFVGFAPGQCPQGQYCSRSGCRTGCWIEGEVLETDTVDPKNPCQSCQPFTAPASWTSLVDGAACASGAVCLRGTCQTACAIGGQLQAPGAIDATNPCLSCQPDKSTVSWWPISGAAGACGGTSVCDRGACRPGCFIDGGFAAPGSNPTNACLLCDPAVSTGSWTPALDGTPCQGSSYCSGGTCRPGCFIGGAFYLPGQADPNDGCKACRLDSCRTDDWSVVPNGSACQRNGFCQGDQCILPPFSTCLPAGATCIDGGAPCCSDSDGGLYGGCGDAGVCGCLPLNVFFNLPYGGGCHAPEPACCSTVCAKDTADFITFCSCLDAGSLCSADVQCCDGCCTGGSCN